MQQHFPHASHRTEHDLRYLFPCFQTKDCTDCTPKTIPYLPFTSNNRRRTPRCCSNSILHQNPSQTSRVHHRYLSGSKNLPNRDSPRKQMSLRKERKREFCMKVFGVIESEVSIGRRRTLLYLSLARRRRSGGGGKVMVATETSGVDGHW
jgi:hypothetical protein